MDSQQLGCRLVDTVGAQQGLGVAGVLAGYRICQCQHVQGAQRDVGQVAYRGGDHIQRAGRIILSSSGVSGGA